MLTKGKLRYYNLSMHKIFSIRQSLVNVFGNLRKLLVISWNEDKFLTFGYMASSGMGAFFPIAASYVFKLFIDEIISSKGVSVDIPIILIALLASRYLIDASWDFVMWVVRGIYFDFLFRYKFQNILNYIYYKKVVFLDLEHFENPKIQDLMTKAQDTFTWKLPNFFRGFASLLNNMISYVVSFIILIPFGVQIPALMSLVTIPQLFLRAKYGRLQWSIYGSGAPEVRKLWYLSWLLREKRSVVEARIFQSNRSLLKKFRKTQKYLYELNKKPVVEFMRAVMVPQVVKYGVLFIFAYSKIPEVLNQSMSVGDFTFFVSLLDRVTNSATDMILNFGEMYEDNLYVNHYFEVLNLPRLVNVAQIPVEIDFRKPPKIEFKDVSFIYPGTDKYVLKDVNFSISPSENIAIVGANGAGKTTIVKLLCRFYDVTKGEILVNGINIKDLDLKSWYRSIGTLFQEFMHYDFTVKENIMLGNPGVRDNELVLLAAKQSGAEDFIKDLPQKYDQLLGRQFEGGVELSQGQWQKIAIARAFYEGAPILILDEPTSAIDAESEYEIFQNLNKYYKDKTLFLISHRFSTVRNADKIIVLKDGEISESGGHEELLAIDGTYARMFKKQALGYQ
ncbi:MAG: ABC transporter, ATP-binding/permease protein [Candidatus Woesebacteria bacterium GW2011_GWA1_39_21b]|uniref:ABC transporter, ATP-binding/permease protein n=3 Tax=Candidatus Woeseibacteriota TaxID=1752722 RepID=A0A0G0RCI7_9BACT|nr:MAG: hypothetical protein US72_C0008G0059 [Microgenomates group bacterium GW2011_GWC1_38_12]KKR11417.1 MAG: ABC transporter, ATP-binding/permease protein [Candidatus Woesebacteria bacterium GW2011_GWA1_39_21b]